jgi:hypothetical protein
LFGGLLRDLDEGYLKRVAFVVPPGVARTLPAYELALMTAWQAWGMGPDDVQVTIFTPEDAPLGLFGTAATVGLRHDLGEAGVEVETGVSATEGGDAPGQLIIPPDLLGKSRASTRCGRPATQSPPRSSRAASPPSKPTRPLSRSPRTPAPKSSHGPTAQCFAA